MNTTGTIAMLTDKDAAGSYKIPFIIYSDAYFSETVAYADLVLPDTTYLERHDCISLLDRPISHADGPGDAIRQPVVAPDRDVRPFQSVLLDLGARLELPGMVDEQGQPKYRDYADYIVSHERSPGLGPLAGWRGEGRREPRTRRAEPEPAAALHRERRLLAPRSRRTSSATTRWRTAAISTSPSRWASWRKPEPIVFQLYSRAAAALPPGRARPRDGAAAGKGSRAHRNLFRPAADLVRAARGGRRRGGRLPAARADAAADAHVPFLGLAECVAAADHQPEPAVRAPRDRAPPRRGGRRLGLDREPSRARQGAGAAGRRRQPRHGLDLERHRQAARRLDAEGRRAGGGRGLPAQPRDQRAAAAGCAAAGAFPTPIRSPARRRGSTCASACADARRRRWRARSRSLRRSRRRPVSRRLPAAMSFGAQFRRLREAMR